MDIFDTFLEGLRLAANMGWKTLWALVLGFTISGTVQTFVSEEKMSRALGGQGLKEILLGTLFGAASSSCSFGAVATTKSLFKKGASAVASFAAFQFASTNLVIELGLVMWVLLGWQFVLANVVSGLFLIILLSLVFRFLVPQSWIDEAREHVREVEGVRDPQCGMEVDPDDDDTVTWETEEQTFYFCSQSCKESYKESGGEETPGLMSVAGWKSAFRNALSDWQMLWKDILAGFVIAGLIASFVPREWWTNLFGFGADGSFLNVFTSCFLGVLIGVITFVCSVGNVPFAVVLWKNGIPFGGVMSFIFADLIVPNITNAYRRYYGLRMAATLFFSVFFCAVVVGVMIHYVALGVGLLPIEGVGGTAPEGYTKYLNAVFGALLIFQFYWTRKSANSEES